MKFTLDENVKVPNVNRYRRESIWDNVPIDEMNVDSRITFPCFDEQDAKSKRASLMCHIRTMASKHESWAKKCFVSRTLDDKTFAIYRTF
jgi:hypothetical protein